MLSSVGDHIIFLTRFRTYKLLHHYKQNTRRGGGLRQINTSLKVPLQVNIVDSDIWHCFLSVYEIFLGLGHDDKICDSC